MDDARLQRILNQTEIIGKDQLDQIPIVEYGEQLVELARVAPSLTVSMTNTRRAFAGAEPLLARESVVQMLQQTAELLAPDLRLVVYDAYRPIEYQRQRYMQVYEETRARYLDAPEEQVRALVFQVVFPPDEDPSHPPPHATGGAVDLTIARSDGTPLYMGSHYGIYNDPEENERHKTNSTAITPSQRQNRVALIEAMVTSGFCNYPGEWWHFMYGDREYAAYEGLPTAKFGRADLLGIHG